MSDVGVIEEDAPPVAGAMLIYLGPVAPHWEIRGTWGDSKMIDAFRLRVNARLLLLPKHDPQFRRNRERVNRDAERELITLEWDLGDDMTEKRQPPPAPAEVPMTAPEPVAVVEPEAVIEPETVVEPEAVVEAEAVIETEAPAEE